MDKEGEGIWNSSSLGRGWTWHVGLGMCFASRSKLWFLGLAISFRSLVMTGKAAEKAMSVMTLGLFDGKSIYFGFMRLPICPLAGWRRSDNWERHAAIGAVLNLFNLILKGQGFLNWRAYSLFRRVLWKEIQGYVCQSIPSRIQHRWELPVQDRDGLNWLNQEKEMTCYEISIKFKTV